MQSRWWRRSLSWLATAALVLSLVPSAVAADSAPEKLPQGGGSAEVRPGELLVRFRPQQMPEHMGASLQAVGARQLASMGEGDEQVLLVQVADLAAALPRLQADPRVLYAEPNRVRSVLAAPNDPYYAQQWGLKKIQAEAGWQTMSTANAVPVKLAMVDTGIDGR